MEFMGVGYQELLVIFVLLLVVVGPERLPNVAYQIGRAVRQMQRYARAVRDEFSEEIGYLEEQYKTVKGEIDTASDTFRKSSADFDSELRGAIPKAAELPPLMPHLPGKDEASTPAPSSNGATNGATPHADEPKAAEAAPPPPPLVF